MKRTAAGITCTAFSAKTRAASSAKSSCGGARSGGKGSEAARGAVAVLCDGGNAPPQAGSRAVPSRTLLESRRRRRIQSTHALKCEF